MRLPSDRDRRALLLGATVLSVLLVGSRGVPSLVQATSRARADARALAVLVQDTRAVIAQGVPQAPVLAGAPLDSAIFTAASRAGLASRAAALAASAATAGALRLTQLRADTPDSVRNGLSRVVITMAAECDVAGCMSFISDVEALQPALRIAHLRVMSPDPFGAPSRAERLQLEAVLEALGRVRPDP